MHSAAIELAATSRQGKLTEGHITWTWKRQPVRVGFDRLGEGSTLLLLPAFSSISARQEMRLSRRSSRPNSRLLLLIGPVSEISLGRPWLGNLLLIRDPAARPDPGRTAPVRDSSRWSCRNLRALGCCSQAWVAWTSVPRCAHMARPITDYDAGPTFGRNLDYPSKRSPLLGSLLYRLNVNTPVVHMMARGHVDSDPSWLTGERLQQKMAVISAPGARYASIRFVTGMLDLIADRTSFIEMAKGVKDPILVLYGAGTPRRSKAEMEALASLPHIESAELPLGKLAVHEEFPDAVVEKLMPVLHRLGTPPGSG